ncbi:MAG: hypothetical protein HOO67_00185 [Candidatus Peribacteraceae bacterium]|nr:hypothetical protein [Candidatus Peribacteraceae bacterium]
MSSDDIYIRHMVDAISEIQDILDGRTYKEFVLILFECTLASVSLKFLEKRQIN